MGISDFTPWILVSILGTALYAVRVSLQVKRQVSRISTGKIMKIKHLCQVVDRNHFNEWNRLGRLVRVGSDEYRKALETPGRAIMHLDGSVEEGEQ